MQEKRPRDRGKGLSPAPGQCVRTGGAGTAHHRSAAGADQRTPAAASDLSAAAAEFSGLVFTAAIADGCVRRSAKSARPAKLSSGSA